MARIDHLVNHDDPTQVEQFIEHIRSQRGRQIWCQQDKTRQRSIGLNNYYFGVVLQYIHEHTGHSVYGLHTWFKRKFLPNIIFEDEMDLCSTTDCTGEDMWAYCEMIRSWAHFTFRETAQPISSDGEVFTIPDPYSVVRVKTEVRKPRAFSSDGSHNFQ